MKKFICIFMIIMIGLLCSCAVNTENNIGSNASINEPTQDTLPIETSGDNEFETPAVDTVSSAGFSEAQKGRIRRVFTYGLNLDEKIYTGNSEHGDYFIPNPHIPKFTVAYVDTISKSTSCDFSSDDFLEAVTYGMPVHELYETVGYPQSRLIDYQGRISIDYELAMMNMSYFTTDGYEVIVQIDLALTSQSEEAYEWLVRYVTVMNGRTVLTMIGPSVDESIQYGFTPTFLAVEQLGIDYMIEHHHISENDVLLYAAEEATYQANQAEFSIQAAEPNIAE